MTNQEAIANLNMINVAFVETVTKEQRKLINDTFDMAIKALEQEPSGDLISREYLFKVLDDFCGHDRTATITLDTLADLVYDMPSVKQEPKTGHWCRKTKVDAYDIAGVKTWGIKCQCDKCDFTTIVVEDFGYYKYCPNCGARMESEDKE